MKGTGFLGRGKMRMLVRNTGCGGPSYSPLYGDLSCSLLFSGASEVGLKEARNTSKL